MVILEIAVALLLAVIVIIRENKTVEEAEIVPFSQNAETKFRTDNVNNVSRGGYMVGSADYICKVEKNTDSMQLNIYEGNSYAVTLDEGNAIGSINNIGEGFLYLKDGEVWYTSRDGSEQYNRQVPQ